jgi:hypothetical protein
MGNEMNIHLASPCLSNVSMLVFLYSLQLMLLPVCYLNAEDIFVLEPKRLGGGGKGGAWASFTI